MLHGRPGGKLRIGVLGVRIIISVLVIAVLLIIKLRSAAGDTADFRDTVTEGGDTAEVVSYIVGKYNEITQ